MDKQVERLKLVGIIISILVGIISLGSPLFKYAFIHRIGPVDRGYELFLLSNFWIGFYILFVMFGISLHKFFMKISQLPARKVWIKYILTCILLLIYIWEFKLLFIEQHLLGEFILDFLFTAVMFVVLPIYSQALSRGILTNQRGWEFQLLVCGYILIYLIIMPLLIGDMAAIIQLLIN